MKFVKLESVENNLHLNEDADLQDIYRQNRFLENKIRSLNSKLDEANSALMYVSSI